MSLDYLKKAPSGPPTWVAILRDAAIDERLDEATPTRRALLVATALLDDAPSANRETFVRRFAVALDREPLRLYELERQVSPAAPVEQVEDHIAYRVERAMRGLS
jgi:hypothetical protein